MTVYLCYRRLVSAGSEHSQKQLRTYLHPSPMEDSKGLDGVPQAPTRRWGRVDAASGGVGSSRPRPPSRRAARACA
eukprot:2555652-Pleurochrysis_carterae.AAC.2